MRVCAYVRVLSYANVCVCFHVCVCVRLLAYMGVFIHVCVFVCVCCVSMCDEVGRQRQDGVKKGMKGIPRKAWLSVVRGVYDNGGGIGVEVRVDYMVKLEEASYMCRRRRRICRKRGLSS